MVSGMFLLLLLLSTATTAAHAVVFPLDPRASYLHADFFDTPASPLVIDLGALQVGAGDILSLEQLGDMQLGRGNSTVPPFFTDDVRSTIGVFSAGAEVLSAASRNRVPGAIDAGVDHVTTTTAGVGVATPFQPTDIPQDFAIALHDRSQPVVVQVPPGATHLIVGAEDSFFGDNLDPDGDFRLELLIVSGSQAPPSTQIAAAVLPSSRSVQVGRTATVAASMINAGTAIGMRCRISPPVGLAANFSFRPTDPFSNSPVGDHNETKDVGVGANQTFALAITPTAAFPPSELRFIFSCANASPAASLVGVNTLLLSASDTPVPDMVALAAVAGGAGIVDVPLDGTGLFAVATSNVGATSTITAQVSPRPADLPLDFSICQTDPASGACISPASPSVTTTAVAGGTPSFGIFIGGRNQPVTLDPADNRLVVNFVDAEGLIRGSTSVAVQTTGAALPPPPSLSPDLVVIAATPGASVQVGQSFGINANVSNQGTGTSPATALFYRLSANAVIGDDDPILAITNLASLGAGADRANSAVVSIESVGSFFIGVCVQTVAQELNTANNCSNAIPLTVTTPPPLPQVALTVSVLGNGSVTSSPPGIACPGSCTAPFAANTNVLLVASPATGDDTFLGYSSPDPNCAGLFCAVVLTSDLTVGATFDREIVDPGGG